MLYNEISVDKQMSLYYSTFTYNLQSQTKTLNNFGKISLHSVSPSLLRCSGKVKCGSVSRILSEDCSFHQQLMTKFFYFLSEEILRWSRQGQREIHVGVGSLSKNGYLQKLFEEASRKKEKKLATLVPLFWSYHNEKWKTTARGRPSRFLLSAHQLSFLCFFQI